MDITNEKELGEVPERAKQLRETIARKYKWVERSIWTDRMLEALERGVKGGVWFSLIDKVYRSETLYSGWRTVKRNGGSAGVDHQSVKAFDRESESEIERLSEELRAGTYRPRGIRRIYIPKPGSQEKRPLGIPCVRDRVVQAALRLVIEPIFERAFFSNSYGCRPERGAKDALREVDRLLKAGYIHVVDADLKSYFDTIPHLLLMDSVRERIADGRILSLIEMFLKQDIMVEGVRFSPKEGSPQGAVISPLLANLYLNEVDRAMIEAGYNMIRYMDDIVILCEGEGEAVEALNLIRQKMKERSLSLHPEKTRVVNALVRGQGFEFLGYYFEAGKRRPRKKSLKRLKDKIRSRTGRSNGHSLTAIIDSINPTLKGWFEYFKHSNKWTFPTVDKWVRRRLRSILRKRIGLKGISRGLDHQRWPNQFFWENGLFFLEDAHRSLLQSL